MTLIEQQLQKEARYDVKVALIGLAMFFVFGLLLPKACFWYWFAPLALFWFRYLWVRNKRDEALLAAELAASGRLGTAGCYASEAGICISDGTHHVLVARDDAKAPLQLPHIVGRK
jgi:hypothetical protein